MIYKRLDLFAQNMWYSSISSEIFPPSTAIPALRPELGVLGLNSAVLAVFDQVPFPLDEATRQRAKCRSGFSLTIRFTTRSDREGFAMRTAVRPSTRSNQRSGCTVLRATESSCSSS